MTNQKRIKEFLKPDVKKCIIFAIFTFIVYAGYTQSWVFSGKETGAPKPPLFDLLAPFPFLWGISALLLLPISLLYSLIITIGGHFIAQVPNWLFRIINRIFDLVYLYLLSCLIIFVWSKFKFRTKNKAIIYG